jgi:hypothetical protein
VTFGTGLSYFACAPGHGSTWAGVSTDLTAKVQKAFDTPSCVSLGMNEAWFIMWPDGYFSWKFYGNYKGLDKILNEAAPRSVSVSIQCTHDLTRAHTQTSISRSLRTTRSTTLLLSRTAQSSTISKAFQNGSRKFSKSLESGRPKLCRGKRISNPTHQFHHS